MMHRISKYKEGTTEFAEDEEVDGEGISRGETQDDEDGSLNLGVFIVDRKLCIEGRQRLNLNRIK